jgi:hypothetical protein
MKKNGLNILGLTAPTKLAALTLIFALVLAGCGANPKGLAKQTYDLYEQSIAALSNPLKLPGVMLKASSLGEKVNNLSERDKKIYKEELTRLGGEGLDSLFGVQKILDTLFGDGAVLGGLLGDIAGLDGLLGDGGGSAQFTILGDDPGSAQSGGGVKPALLSSKATHKESIAKWEEIIAYCNAHSTPENDQLKNSIVTQKLSFQVMGLVWGQYSSEVIEELNAVISELE